MEEWAEIRRLHVAEGLSQRAIADRLGRRAEDGCEGVGSQGPPSYSRPPAASVFDGFEDRVRVLLSEFPSMPASVIAERLGWAGSASWFQTRAAGAAAGIPPGPTDQTQESTRRRRHRTLLGSSSDQLCSGRGQPWDGAESGGHLASASTPTPHQKPRTRQTKHVEPVAPFQTSHWPQIRASSTSPLIASVLGCD